MATIRVRRLAARYRRPITYAVLMITPSLALLGTSAATSATVFAPAGVNAGDEAWLDELTAPVAEGPGGVVVPLDPTSPVLPSDGNLQVLTITQGGSDGDAGDPASAADDIPVIPDVPPVGDVTPTYRLSRSGIPLRVLQSYAAAADMIDRSLPGCRIHWSLVAGIGRVESNHGRFGGSSVTATGKVVPPILGPRLDGSRSGWATIRDTDDGRYDGDTRFDRAVGPMQFLPGTWKHYGSDGDGNGTADPQDTDDAALATARYLCADGMDLSTRADQWRAVMRYNHSRSYAALVIGLADTYRTGTAEPVPAPPADLPAPPSDGETASPRRPAGPVLPPDTGSVTPLPRTGTGTSAGPVPLPSPSGPGTLPPGTPTTGPTTPSPTPTDPGTPTASPLPTDTAVTPAPTDTAATPAPTDTATAVPVDPTATPAPTTPAPADTATVPPPDPATTTPVDPAPAPTTPAPAPAPAPVDTTTAAPAAAPAPTSTAAPTPTAP